ncbi:MAG: C39 family peptidase [Treponemataceae bacterium]|nr:C39 family peptidase [Treponemataceae bacterium]
MKILVNLVLFLLNTFIITTIIDIILMGFLHPRFSRKSKEEKFFVKPRPESLKTESGSYFEFQGEFECAGFSSAFILRHLGFPAEGFEIYKEVPKKMGRGYVYPKGIPGFFKKRGLKMTMCTGNLNALKKELVKGNPVIIFIRSFVGQSYLHFVTVTGYDQKNIYLAESIKSWVNADDKGKLLIEGQETSSAEQKSESSVGQAEGSVYYNRIIPVSLFKKLWNTSMLKMPLYRNVFYVLEG